MGGFSIFPTVFQFSHVLEAAEKYAGNQPVSAGVQFPYPHNTGADPELYTQPETEKNNADRHLCAAFYFHSGSGGHDVRILRSCGRGIGTTILKGFGMNNPQVLTDPASFPHLYVSSAIWQTTGWSSIIYIAALSGVSPELHEAAIADGASKLQRIIYIDIPMLIPTAVILLILNCGNIMNLGFEKVYLMQTAPNLSTSEVISTYVYKIGLQGQQNPDASAIGLFNNIINFTILILVNQIAGKTTENSLW